MSSAYVIASVHVTNTNEFEKYRLQVPSVTESYGGKYLARGENNEHWKASLLSEIVP